MTDTTDYVHAGPGTLMGAVLRQAWQPVALADGLAPGRAIPVRILNEDLTVYLGESGAPHVVAPRCAHRGTQLSTGWVEGDCLRCFYHGWKYDGSGQCVEMPAEDPSFPPKVKIKSYPAQIYAGLIFAYLGEGEPPPMWRFVELDRDYGVKWTETKVWPCNWFQRLENALDSAHLAFVHSGSEFGGMVTVAPPRFEHRETAWGMELKAIRSADNLRINELHFPNVIHIRTPVLTRVADKLPWSDLINWYVPVDDEMSVLFSSRSAPLVGEAAREFAERLPPHRSYNPADQHDALFANPRLADDPTFAADPVSAQDYVAQLGQGRIADRTQERLGKTDAGIIFMRSLYRREMEAVQRGEPGKHWQPKTNPTPLPVPPGVPDLPVLA
ncbi:MAG TPA: Rieske 2Fe-2S domain-containing protein [Chloroflexota bacterium]|jgi:5,5'-dehydrodivanillate O-demethylase